MIEELELRDLYCHWCPDEDDYCRRLSIEEKRGCVACRGFVSELLPIIRAEIQDIENPYPKLMKFQLKEGTILTALDKIKCNKVFEEARTAILKLLEVE